MLTSLSAERALVFFGLLMSAAVPLEIGSPWAVLWTAPAILVASIVIAWGAESAQFFVAQGFALAMLAWMQTLPEFAVEAVLAWKQQSQFLMANLTGAVRLLTGLAWPIIFVTAAAVHKRRTGRTLKCIALDRHHSVEVVSSIAPLLYAGIICYKRSLHFYDGLALIGLYALYLLILTKLPPESHEGVEDLESIPRRIVLAPRLWRNLGIAACFLAGGLLIYFAAEPFLGSLIALATAFGIPSFFVIQWLAPVISEFPEMLSTFYFARQPEKAPVALMNVASSNLNQWTLLFGLLPIVFSMGHGGITAIQLDAAQQQELLLTIAQSLVALAFLANMQFSWIEALSMFVLFALQFVAPVKPWITDIFFAWFAAEVLRMAIRRRLPAAFAEFAHTWRTHVASS